MAQKEVCIMTRENDWVEFWARASKFGYKLGEINRNGLFRCLFHEMVEGSSDEDFLSYLKDFSRKEEDQEPKAAPAPKAPKAVKAPATPKEKKPAAASKKEAKAPKAAAPAPQLAPPAAAPLQLNLTPAGAAKTAKTPKGKGGGPAPATAPAIVLSLTPATPAKPAGVKVTSKKRVTVKA